MDEQNRTRLFANWTEDVEKRARLNRYAIAKDLDLPISAVEGFSSVKINKTGTDGTKVGGIVLATAALTALGTWLALNQAKAPIPQPTPPIEQQAPEVEDLKLKVKWWVDEDGNIHTEVDESEKVK